MAKGEFSIGSLKLRIINITPEIRLESNKYWAKAFNEALSNNYALKIEIDKMLESKGYLDTSAEDAKLEASRLKIYNLEKELRKGLKDGRRMTKEEGRSLAMQIRTERRNVLNTTSRIVEYYNNTAENYADNERFQYFIYACTVYADDGKRYWKSYDVFKADLASDVYGEAVKTFFTTLTGVDKDYEKNYYENQWLQRMGYMNDKLQLIDSQGRLVDDGGRLINSDGKFTNEAGQLINIYGDLVDEKGNILADEWVEESLITKSETSQVSIPAV